MYKKNINQQINNLTPASIELDVENSTLYLMGAWVWMEIDEKLIAQQLDAISTAQIKHINGTKLQRLDTAGSYFINKVLTTINPSNTNFNNLALNAEDLKLFNRVAANYGQTKLESSPSQLNPLVMLGAKVSDIGLIALQMVTFFGYFLANCIHVIRYPTHLAWDEVVRTITNTGAKGLFVAALLSFLIGSTLAYEMAPQFVTYGANIYVVNFLGISLLKEVSPLLTAIIVSGRTGSAITAEIGTMKIREEIDALQTMGISPMHRLVVPKVLGVFIALPIITAAADVASMLGGAIISKSYLNIPYSLFFNRLHSYVAMSNYTDGIIKSLVFAIAISLTGCFCGFNVRGDANSIGEQTTKSVVICIILVVFVDAIFAVIFDILNI